MNGGGPPERLLKDVHYQMIKNGILVVGGAQDGCIKFEGDIFYWITPDGKDANLWQLMQGTPTGDITKITQEVWDKCKAGGDYDWDDKYEYWEDDSHNRYRFAGFAGGDVSLVLYGN
jgi:hypothetical protein